MSLALAEILFKQDGGSSLDLARSENAHHGLTLKTIRKPSVQQSLVTSAGMLSARPLEIDGKRFGTFDLWHRSAREAPVCGKIERMFPNGGGNEAHAVFLAGLDERMPLLPNAGVSLLNCFSSLPGMAAPLGEYNVVTDLVRSRFKMIVGANNMATMTIIIHPNSDTLLNAVYERIKLRHHDWESISVTELPSGCVIESLHGPGFSPAQMHFPISIQSDAGEVSLCTQNHALNEFGLFYIGMYILGNYARYFPEQWMADVETSSPLANVSEAFVRLAEERVPLLALNELSQAVHILR